MREPDAIQILLALIDEAFDRQAWHGPTLRGSRTVEASTTVRAERAARAQSKHELQRI